MPDTIYQIGWDDGFENRGFKPEYCDDDTYRRGFCNGAYFRSITPNKSVQPTIATTALEDSPFETGIRCNAVVLSNRNSG